MGAQEQKQFVLLEIKSAQDAIARALKCMIVIHPLAQDTDAYKELQKAGASVVEAMGRVMRLKI